MVARDIFDVRDRIAPRLSIHAAYFEIYGGECYDLLHERKRLRVMENGKKQVQYAPLMPACACPYLLLPASSRGPRAVGFASPSIQS